MKYQMIEPCRPSHIVAISRHLRAEEIEECRLSDSSPRHALFRLLRMSLESCAFVCDAGVIAVAGDAAPLLAHEGLAWLFTSPLIERVPLAFVREGRRWLDRRFAVRSSIVTVILASSTRSVRFYRLLGFEIGEPGPNGICDIRLTRERFYGLPALAA